MSREETGLNVGRQAGFAHRASGVAGRIHEGLQRVENSIMIRNAGTDTAKLELQPETILNITISACLHP